MWNPSRILVVIVVVLLGLGIVMLASSSIVKGEASKDDASYFIKRQLVWLAVGVVATIVAAGIPYGFWHRWAYLLLGGSAVGLGAVLILGAEVLGSKRWLRIGGLLSVQPSEFAKIFVVAALAAWMVRVGPRARRFKEGLLYPALMMGAIAALIVAEPDFGSCILVGAVGMTVMFMGGSRFSYLLVTAVLGACGMALAIMHDRERAERILAFLNPEENPAAAFQLVEAQHSFILGGPFGVGLGNSAQKYFYLPEAHTDFILPIIGEELGLTTCLIALLFIGILVCGTIISLRARDPFARLFGMGITVMLTLQAAINMGVVTGCLPTKGLPLPLISYGGTSLVMTMMCIGILLNIGQRGEEAQDEPEASFSRDRAHRL